MVDSEAVRSLLGYGGGLGCHPSWDPGTRQMIRTLIDELDASRSANADWVEYERTRYDFWPAIAVMGFTFGTVFTTLFLLWQQ